MEGLNILCLHGRWNLVALVIDAGEEIHISHPSVIREWGTSDGLGQLADDGPQEGTKFDPEPDQVVDRIQIIRVIPCNREVWDRSKKWIEARDRRKSQKAVKSRMKTKQTPPEDGD